MGIRQSVFLGNEEQNTSEHDFGIEWISNIVSVIDYILVVPGYMTLD